MFGDDSVNAGPRRAEHMVFLGVLRELCVDREHRDPFRIIEASDTRALNRLLARGRGRDAAFDRRVHRIVDRVREDGDAALVRFARQFDRVTGPLEVSRDEMRDAAARVAPEVRRAIGQAARHIARVARRQLPRTSRMMVAPGVSVEQRVEAIASRGVLRARRPLSAALVAADDRDSGAGGRRRRHHRGVPAAGAGGHGGGARSGGDAVVSRRRRARDWRARVWNGDDSARATRSSAPATAMSRPPRRTWRMIARSISMPGRRRS